MSTTNHEAGTFFSFNNIVDTLIRLAILYLLLGWCLQIIKPFQLILIWGSLITLAVYPLHVSLAKLFGGHKKLSAGVITLALLSIIVIPSWLVTASLINNINHLRDLYAQGTHLIPPPGENTKHWPTVAKPVIDFWQLCSNNLQDAAIQYKDQLELAGTWLISTLGGFAKGVVQFIVSIIVAGVLLIYAEQISGSAMKIFKKLAGEHGESFALITVATIQSVFKGVLGVAFIQAFLAGIGFFAAGVPYAGLWTVVCLVLAVMQVGPAIVIIPSVIYMFSILDTMPATIFAIWMVIVGVSDNILKPILMGVGSPVPILVIFLGSIGGLITAGFIGLFLGAVVLAIAYKLFLSWLSHEVEA